MAVADLVESATLVAVTVCEPPVVGAVYSPVLLTVPTTLLPPTVPSTAHVTAVFVVPVTVAVNCCVADMGTPACRGDTVTATRPTVTGADGADAGLVPTALVAVTVNV